MSLSHSSTSVIFVNTQNNVSTNKSQIVMNFPTPLRVGNDFELSLGSLFIYYSWFNITSNFNNRTYSYKWNGQTFNITMPEGYYSISDILNYLLT